MEILAFAFPPLIDTINRKVTNSRLRFAIAVLICVVYGLAVKYKTLAYSTPLELLQSVGIVFMEAQVSYHVLYHNSGLEQKISGVTQ